ncbi:MAG: segregation and condensation protein A, partial [Bdellovibrionales bacterium]
SRVLLPTYNENGEIVETEDPRKELVQRLLEYEKYKEAAKALESRPWLGRDIWTRGVRESFGEREEEIILEDNALFSLIAMYRKALRSAKKKIHQVTAKTQSIASRILELKDYLLPGSRISFFSLLGKSSETVKEKLITFLSLLELGKLGFATLYQSDNYQDIWIETLKPIETDVVSKVEEYNQIQSDDTANQMFAKAALENEVDVTNMNPNDEEFVLKDGGETNEDEESLFNSQELASDEDILKAEQEIDKGEIGV